MGREIEQRNFRPVARSAPALALAVLIAACGGGGGGSSAPSTPTQQPPPPPPPPPEEPPPEIFDTAEFRRSDGLDNINALPAFEAGGTGAGITVGVVDTGVDPNHIDLDANISPLSQDVVRDGEAIRDGDPDGHGTIVAGLIAAERNDAGILGVAFEATILAARADETDSCAEDCKFTDIAIARGIRHSIDNGARVINISLGGEAFGSAVQSAVREAAASGALVVISAGNEGEIDPGGFAQIALDPFAGDNIIIVGATDQNDQLAGFSNRAGNLMASFLTAPGTGLTSTFPDDRIVSGVAGTSFSAPHVSGAVAVLAQLFPNLTGSDIREILFESARDLGAAGDDEVFGQGLLDLGAAVQPIGTVSVPASETGETAETMTGSGMATSAAFGDALKGSGLLDGILVTDRFDRTFRTDFSDRLVDADAALRVAHLTEPRDRIASGNIAIGAEGGLSFAAFQASEAAAAHNLSSYRQARIDRPAPAMMLTSRLDERTDIALAQGYDAAAVLNRPGHAAPTASLSISERLDTGFVSSSGRGQTMRIGHRLDDELLLDVALIRSSDDADDQAGFAPLRRGRSATSLLAQLGAELGPLRLRGQLGARLEEGSVLGARGSNALSLGGGGRSHFFALDTVLPLGRGWSAFTRSVFARTTARGAGSGLIELSDTLESRAFSAGLEGRSLLAPGDSMVLAVAQPLRITGGSVTARLPVERDFATGRFRFETRRQSLTPSGRETDIELAYSVRLGPSVSFETNVVRQFEAGHVADAPSVTALLLRLRARF